MLQRQIQYVLQVNKKNHNMFHRDHAEDFLTNVLSNSTAGGANESI